MRAGQREGAALPKYLMEAKFTAEGLRGVERDGGTARHAVVKRAVESLGGQLETFYFALGENDSYTIFDMPDNEGAAALSIAVSASGAVTTKVVVLMSPADVDAVISRSVEYRAPGT